MHTSHRRTKTACLSALWPVLGLVAHQSNAAEDGKTLPEVVVTGTREGTSLNETPAAVGVIPKESIERTRPNHPSQIVGQVPGVAVAVTNGEGHTTAIRQPFTTNPVYLFLEDGIPIRSTGFFNHNALYEINIPQAGGIEVTRGPGTALYGSDAIGGIVNVLTRTPPRKPEFGISGELGGHGFWRILTGGGSGYGNGGWRADLNLTHTDGWRDATGYDRQSGSVRWDHFIGGETALKTVFAFSTIDQQTGANSPLTLEDYNNNPKRNYLPIAFRKVDAFRLSTSYEREAGNTLVSLTPYVRDNSMDLLATFTLNFDPTVSMVENRSYGLLAKWRVDFPDAMRARLIVGADIDVSPGDRQEDSLNVSTSGAAPARVFNSFTVARRVYDYDVTFTGISPYLHGEISPTDRVRVVAGLRYDHLIYKFRNHLSGAPIFVAPGTPFPGPRFYGQANDADPKFTHLSPKLGATYALAADTHAFAGYSHGFRAPSEGNLFRPAVGANVAAANLAAQSALSLKPIKADQVEVGLRGLFSRISYRPRGVRLAQARRYRFAAGSRHDVHANRERRQHPPSWRGTRRGRADAFHAAAGRGIFVREAHVRGLGDERRHLLGQGDRGGAARAREHASHMGADAPRDGATRMGADRELLARSCEHPDVLGARSHQRAGQLAAYQRPGGVRERV